MPTDIYLWLVVLSVVLAALAVIIYVLIRQVGYLVHSSSPLAARQESAGPRIGEDLSTHFEELFERGTGRLTFLIFGSKDCSICRYLKTQPLDRVLKYWDTEADFVTAFDESEASVPDELRGGDYTHLFESKELRMSLGIDYVPFSFVMDDQMRVLSKGLVNNLSHFESLLEAAKQRTL